MPGVFRLLVVIDRSEDLFRANKEGGHFPDGHFEVHLREFEESGIGEVERSVKGRSEELEGVV